MGSFIQRLFITTRFSRWHWIVAQSHSFNLHCWRCFLTEISVLPYAGFLGICLGFVTESNKPFIRFGVTGPILKSTTEVTKKNKKIHELPKKIKISKKNRKIHEVTKKIKKSTKKIKKFTNSNFGFHIGYSAAEIRMNFVRRTDRYKSSFGYRGRTLQKITGTRCRSIFE